MKIASINLNKRLGNPDVRKMFETWLNKNRIDLILGQEPWNRGREKPIILKFYDDIGGDDGLHCWIRKKWKKPKVRQISSELLRIDVGYLRIFNVYLSAYSTDERARALRQLERLILDSDDRPVLLTGDFNLAPEPRDGLVDNQISTFTSEEERQNFKSLLSSIQLIDSTKARTRERNIEYTIERRFSGKKIQFRCDIALITRYISGDFKVNYDHTVRKGPEAFTDHSAILIDAPVSLKANDIAILDLFEGQELGTAQSSWQYCPHNTAMARSNPSKIVRELLRNKIINKGDITILDYGCGRGRDVSYLKKLGYKIDGYDPYEQFGFSDPPKSKYDIVLCTFVLNILASPLERLKVLKDVVKSTMNEGLIIISTRSPSAIQKEAKTKRWEKHNDGYWSSMNKGTFQKGIGRDEIGLMLNHLATRVDPRTFEFPSISDTVVVICSKI